MSGPKGRWNLSEWIWFCSNVHYVDVNGEESYMTIDNYPKQLEKKIKLLSYFNRYMRDHLIKAGASVVRETDSLSRIPHLHQWCRSTSGVLMQLNNGTVQVRFASNAVAINNCFFLDEFQ